VKREDFICPDLGNPFQYCDSPMPVEFDLTPQERDRAKVVSIELERHRREQNKREAQQAKAAALGNANRLGVTWADDDGPAAA
jgi:hypothetical protein